MSNHKNKTSWNDVTGDSIRTGKGSQDKFADGWERIFGRKEQKAEETKRATCIKCPRDENKYCDYCGLRQSDGDVAGWAFMRDEK